MAIDQQTIFVAIVAIGFFVFALGLSFVFLGATDPIRRRLDHDSDIDPEVRGRRLVMVNSMVGPVSQWLMPKSEEELSGVMKRLNYAGLRSPNALQTYYGIKGLLAISLPICVMIAARWMPDVSTPQLAFFAFLAASVGVVGPSTVLDKLVEARMKKIRNGFPDALDLLVVCVESGLGLSGAIQRVADELHVSHPELSMELSLVNAETRAGVDRAKALKNLSERTGLDDIRGLVSLLVQTMRFGTSVADALRVYSEEFRDKRMQKAEEQAALIGTKLIFPLVMCLFPSFFLVAIGPAVIRLIDAFAVMRS